MGSTSKTNQVLEKVVSTKYRYNSIILALLTTFWFQSKKVLIDLQSNSLKIANKSYRHGMNGGQNKKGVNLIVWGVTFTGGTFLLV